MYKKAFEFLKKFIPANYIFKYGFNWSPMYRRSVGKLTEVSKDLYTVNVKIPLSWKNKNYVGTIFGGSLFSATDPIYMIQLIHILGEEYVVWDKAATILYKRPATSNTFAIFEFTKEEITLIKQQIAEKQQIDIVKKTYLTSSTGEVFSELEKTIYIASKHFYKQRKNNQV